MSVVASPCGAHPMLPVKNEHTAGARTPRRRWRKEFFTFACLMLNAGHPHAQAGIEAEPPRSAEVSSQKIRDMAKTETPALLTTLAQLVSIETGSTDVEGLNKIGAVVEAHLHDLGMRTEVLAPLPGEHSARSAAQLGPMIKGTLQGNGKLRIALIAHMDTVYSRGILARYPFRIEGENAYGAGVMDDKSGVATIIHTIALLRSLNFRDYQELTVLCNADEEIGSPGSRSTIVQLGKDNDVVLSFEGAGPTRDNLRLATSSIASAILKVTGRASHAGANPEGGRNALYELAHQVLQMRDLSKPAIGLRLNWTTAHAGTVSNAIPAFATATGDMRASNAADFDELEKVMSERIKNKLIADTKVELVVERGRPALQPTEAARRVGAIAQAAYAEIDHQLIVSEQPSGGGTDAAYAASQTSGAVVEGFGLRGAGAHADGSEYVLINSIEPRLYLAVRTIMNLARAK